MKAQQDFRRPARSGQRGIALIEALVGILIFAFGVLGLVGLQASMTKAQTASKYRADASNLAGELIGLMWSDTTANLPSYASGSCAGYARCKGWLGKLKTVLPGSEPTVTVTVASSPGAINLIYDVRIQIAWTQAGGDGAHNFSTEARVEPVR